MNPYLKIDSSLLWNVKNYSSLEIISENEERHIKGLSFDEKCNNQAQYVFKKVGKLDLKDKTALFLVINLNKDCPVDAHVLYYIVCVYDLKGSFIEEKIIGQIYEEFGYTEYKHSTLSYETSKITINVHTKEGLMDENNPDIIHEKEYSEIIILE